MPIQLRCQCGQKLLAKDQAAGRQVRCPKCGGPVAVPTAAVPPPPPLSQQRMMPRVQHTASRAALRPIEPVLFGILLSWVAVGIISILLAIMSMVLAGLFFAIGSVFMAMCATSVLTGKRHAMEHSEANCLFGLAKVVAWDPTQGVLLLKNKKVVFVDDNLHDGGGVTILLPFVGEELPFRAPLEIQTLNFTDHDVLTREYVPIDIQGTIYWRIFDLERFYLLVSREVHTSDDRGSHAIVRSGTPRQLEAGEQWLRLMAEEHTRRVISRVSTGLLVAEQVAAALPAEIQPHISSHVGPPESSARYRAATDGLAATIFQEVEPSVKDYGIELHRVALQEIRLRQEIHQAAVKACLTAYMPIAARREAERDKARLQAEADVIGADALAAREVVGSAQPWTVADFLTQWAATAFANNPKMRPRAQG